MSTYRWLIPLGLAAVAAVSMVACNGTANIKTMTLQPSSLDTFIFNTSNDAQFACFPVTCFQTHGIGCGIDVGSSEVKVGFDWTYDPGTGPCNCWWYNDCVWRGGVGFNLNTLNGKTVIGAQLKWKDRGACATRLFVAGAQWNTFGPPGEEIAPPNSSGPGQIEVGSTVRDWVSKVTSNFGWVFLGSEEGSENQGYPEGDYQIAPANPNGDCIATVGGFTLVVQYRD
jgi:hypothetical protein